MKLNLRERIAILEILPAKNSIVTWRVINSLKELLGVTEDEHKEFNIVINGDTITWNEKGLIEKELPIGQKAAEIIKTALVALNNANKLEEVHISIYEKFVESND